MKLNPPANSSDLDAARQIAMRLHQHRRREDHPAPARDPSRPPLRPRPAPPVSTSPPVPPSWRPSAPTPPPLPVRPPLRRSEAEYEPSTPTGYGLPHGPEPEPPSWDEAPAETAAEIQEPEDALEALTQHAEPAVSTAPPLPDMEPPPLDPEALYGDEPPPVGGAGPLEAIVGGPEEPPFDAMPEPDPFEPPPPEASPFDDPESLVDAPEPMAGLPSEAAAQEEVFDTPPPSWGEIVETCMERARAKGALLADPSGQAFAVRGDWPEPGAEAIASRLVAMMERTLRDSPTRSVSAPLGRQHLTAWRVPVPQGLFTVAFVADAPLRADVRPAIDDEIHGGAGA